MSKKILIIFIGLMIALIAKEVWASTPGEQSSLDFRKSLNLKNKKKKAIAINIKTHRNSSEQLGTTGTVLLSGNNTGLPEDGPPDVIPGDNSTPGNPCPSCEPPDDDDPEPREPPDDPPEENPEEAMPDPDPGADAGIGDGEEERDTGGDDGGTSIGG